MSDLNSTFDLLNGRSKSLPTDRYAYKLTEDHFAMDFVVSDALEVDESKMSAWILFADGRRRDGVGDLLEVGGIDTERHEKNRIVLFDHGKGNHVWSNWPIAKTEDPETGAYTVVIDPVMKIAKANAFFYQGKGLPGAHASADRDFGLHCQQLFDLWAKKFISGGSIGYQVKAARELSPDYETGVPKGLHLLSTLMLECSMVVLPANMDTVKSLRTQGDVAREILAMPTVCGKPLSPYLVKSLQQYAPPKKAMLGWEDRKSTEVPVPTGDLNDTKIPPVKWTPGVGAECKDVEDYPVAREDDVEQKTLPKQGQKAIVLDDALIIGLIGAGTVGIGYLVNQAMRWLHDVDEDEFHSRLRKMEKEGKIVIRDGNVSVIDPAQHRNVKALRSRYRKKDLNVGLQEWVTLYDGQRGEVVKVDPQYDSVTVRLTDGRLVIVRNWMIDVAAKSLRGLKDFPTEPNARKILHDVLMGEISPGDAVGMLIKAGMRREQAEREVRLTVQSISSLNQKLLHRKDMPVDPNVRKVLKALIYGLIDDTEAVDLLMRRAGMSREDAQKEVGVTTQEMGHYPKSLRGEKRVQIDEESDGWYVRFIPEVVEGVDYRDDMGPFESMEDAESTVRRKYPHQHIDRRNKLGRKSKSWRVVKESDGWWVRGYNEDSEDEGPFESQEEARERLGEPNFPAGYSHRYKSLQVKFNWADNPNGTAYEHRRIWISQNDGSPRQVTFAELHSMLGEEAAKQAIKTSIRQGTSRWHEVKSLWDYAVTYKVTGDGILLYEGENEQAANRSAQSAKRSGKYQSVILHDSGLGETRVKRGQKSFTMLALGVMSLVSATLAGLKLSDILWQLTRGDESKENEVLNAVERLQREGKVEIVGDRVVRKRGGSPQGKSLDLSSTRKKYRPTKGLRRRLRKSAPGVSVMHVASKDIDAARELAETSGVKFAHIGNSGGFARVKLIGADDGIDAVAREYGKRIKSLRGTMSSKNSTGRNGTPKQKDMRVYTTPRAGSDIPQNARRVRDSAGLLFSYAKPGDTGGWHLVYPRGTDLQRVINTLRQVGIQAVEMDNGVYFEGKSLRRKGKSMDTDDVMIEDEAYGKGMDDETNWPVGAQVLKRLLEDHKQLLQDYDEMMGPLEHDGVKAMLQKKLEMIAGELDEWETAAGKHYPDYNDSIIGQVGQKEMDEEEDIDVEDIDGELDELDLDEDIVEDKDMDTMDDAGIPADSDPEPEPTAEEALEGMEYKRLRGRLRRKSLGEDEEEKRLFRRRKDLEEEEVIEEEGKRLRSRRKSACACGKEPCECTEKGLRRRRKDFEEEMVEMDVEPKGLESHELVKIGEASQHAKDLAGKEQLEEEDRMKSFHYHKTLEGMAEIEDMATEGKSEFVGDPEFWAEEAVETEHKDLPPGEIGADMPNPEDVPGQPVAKNLHPHRKACKDASIFFGDAARTKDWGETHRRDAEATAKALEEISAAPSDAAPPPEEEGFEVGEMGEKGLRDETARLLAGKASPREVQSFMNDTEQFIKDVERSDGKYEGKIVNAKEIADSFDAWQRAGGGKSIKNFGNYLKRKAMKTHSWHKNQDVTEELDDEAKKLLKKTLMEQRKQLIELQRMGKALNGLSQSR